MRKWVDLVQDNKEEILTVASKAFNEAVKHLAMRYVVMIDEEGKVDYYEDLAGGNALPEAVYNGQATALFEICFNGCDITEDEADDMVLNCMDEILERRYDEMLERMGKEEIYG